MPESTGPAILLLHDGELADVLALLSRMDLPPVERRGRPGPADIERPWDLVIATPRRLLELVDRGSAPERCVAVLDKDSKTARAMLQRSGVRHLVRRPVHPQALRLFLLYSLYRGPEKRRDRRVSVGTPVQLRAGGFRRRRALLADLSQTGARLLLDHDVAPGRRARLYLPAPLAPRGLRLRAVVVRACAAEDTRFGRFEVALRFEDASAAQRQALSRAIAVHRAGPAMLERPVEAGRVLVGRDLSPRGMRVDADAGVAPGDRLALALHVRTREQPVVVGAEVAGDGAAGGLILRFVDVSEDAQACLARAGTCLSIAAPDAARGDAGLVVSEILAREQAR